MITFVSGLPGHGKTLNTLIEIDKNQKDRPIYYLSKESVDTPGAGIAGVKIPRFQPFTNFEAWFSLPDKSVIIFDECQYIFPPRGRGGDVPEYLNQFTEHRKKGFDIYLITQDVMNVDSFIRRLAGQHIHFHRAFGMQRTTRWEFDRVVNPYKKSDQQNAVSKKMVKFDSAYFELYDSANYHTVKRNVPFKIFLLPIAIILVILTIYFSYYSLTTQKRNNEQKKDTIINIPQDTKILASNIPAKLPANIRLPSSNVPLNYFDELRSYRRGITLDKLSTVHSSCTQTRKYLRCMIDKAHSSIFSNVYCTGPTTCVVLFDILPFIPHHDSPNSANFTELAAR